MLRNELLHFLLLLHEYVLGRGSWLCAHTLTQILADDEWADVRRWMERVLSEYLSGDSVIDRNVKGIWGSMCSYSLSTTLSSIQFTQL